MLPEAKARLAPPGNYILLLRPSMPETVLWWVRIDRELIGDNPLRGTPLGERIAYFSPRRHDQTRDTR